MVRGWEIVSANFIQSRYIQSYWKVNTEGCENVEWHPDSKVWRIAQSIRVTDNALWAEDYVADLDGSLSFYFLYFTNLYRNRSILTMPKRDLNVADNNLELDYVIRSMVTFVNVDSALDQLVALCESWGPFSTLLMVGQDWDGKVIWHQSVTLLAEEVIPCLN